MNVITEKFAHNEYGMMRDYTSRFGNHLMNGPEKSTYGDIYEKHENTGILEYQMLCVGVA